jgi:uncharacterized membrane protein
MSKKTKKMSVNADKSVNSRGALSLTWYNIVLQKIKTNPSLIILAIIILVGSYLRFHALGSEALWLDEAVTYRIGSLDLVSEVWDNAIRDRHPPLHFLIIHLVTIFSSTEFALRLPSAIFGILTIPALYLLAQTMFGKKEALLSAFILSISTFHIYYSQESRMYAQMVFFSLMSIYFIYRAYLENNKWLWVGFAVSGACAFWSFYYTIFVIIPEMMFYLLIQFKDSVREKRIVVGDIHNLRNFVLSILGLGLLISPLIVPFVSQSISRTSSSPTWGVGQSMGFFTTILKQFSVSDTGMYFLLPFFLIGVVFLIKEKTQWKEGLLLGLVFSVPFAASYILAASMPFSPRHVLFILPVYILIISRGVVGVGDYLSFLGRSTPKKQAVSFNSVIFVLAFIFILSLVSAPSVSSYYSSPQKNDWDSAARFFAENSNSGDVIVLLPSYMTQPFEFYYEQNDRIVTGASSSEDLENVNSIYNDTKIWYVATWDIAAANPEGDAVEWLNENTIGVGQITGIFIFTNR